MSEWKEFPLQRVIDKFIDYRGKTPEKTQSGIPLITAKIVKNGTILEPNEFIAKEDYASWMTRGLPQKNDVLITTEAPLGEVALLQNEKVALAQRIILLRGKREFVDNVFLKYALQGRLMQHRIQARATGTTVQGIKAAELKKVEIPLPHIEEQRHIAAVLSVLDNKIDLLRRQNVTLERLAQTLFTRWFVDFEFPNEVGQPYKSSGGTMVVSEFGEIPMEWRVGVLSDEFEIIMGQSPPGESYNENNEGMIFFQGRTDFGFRFPTVRLFTRIPKRIAEKFDTLVSVRAPVGDVNMASEKCCLGRGLSAVRSRYRSYCHYKIKAFKRQFNMFESEGTVFGSLNKQNFNNLESLVPLSETVSKFDKIVKPLDLKIYNNENQIQTLTQLRDTLLPKLMNGQIRVNTDIRRDT